jgi:hypothetical protein
MHALSAYISFSSQSRREWFLTDAFSRRPEEIPEEQRPVHNLASEEDGQ